MKDLRAGQMYTNVLFVDTLFVANIGFLSHMDVIAIDDRKEGLEKFITQVVK